jgi:hypothetical protein
MPGDIPLMGGGAENTQQIVLKMDNLDNKIHKTMGILFAKIMILKDDRI